MNALLTRGVDASELLHAHVQHSRRHLPRHALTIMQRLREYSQQPLFRGHVSRNRRERTTWQIDN